MPPLTTTRDLRTLSSWSLLTDYMNNTGEFVSIGKIVYQTIAQYSGNAPNGPIDLEQPLIAALQTTDVFKRICAAKYHAHSHLYLVFARALARYVLDHEWHALTTQP